MSALVALVLSCCDNPIPSADEFVSGISCETCGQSLTEAQFGALTCTHEGDFDHRGACTTCGAAFCTVRSGGSYYDQPDFCDNRASVLIEPELLCPFHAKEHEAAVAWERLQLEADAWVVRRLVEEDGFTPERAVQLYEAWQYGDEGSLTTDEHVLVSAASRAVWAQGRLGQ